MSDAIVCGVDGSPASLAAAGVARELAAALERRLVLAHAARRPAPLPYGGTWMREAQAATVAYDGRALLERLAPEAAHRVDFAEPARFLDLVARGEDAELLVIGAGRLAETLLSEAPCPVMLVPECGPGSMVGAAQEGEGGGDDPPRPAG